MFQKKQFGWPDGFNSLKDYVEACDKKWAPFTEGIEDEVETGVEAAKTRVAWILEQEARYMNALSQEERDQKIGLNLKFVFPVLRRAIVSLPLGETEFTKICASIEESFDVVCKVGAFEEGGEVPSPEERRALTGALGERIQVALLRLAELD